VPVFLPFPAGARACRKEGRGQGGDILCQPSAAMILDDLIRLAGQGQAACAVIAPRARLRLAMWTASS
jgi:hypothetical protein